MPSARIATLRKASPTGTIIPSGSFSNSCAAVWGAARRKASTAVAAMMEGRMAEACMFGERPAACASSANPAKHFFAKTRQRLAPLIFRL